MPNSAWRNAWQSIHTQSGQLINGATRSGGISTLKLYFTLESGEVLSEDLVHLGSPMCIFHWEY
jgi:hypothetical protein